MNFSNKKEQILKKIEHRHEKELFLGDDNMKDNDIKKSQESVSSTEKISFSRSRSLRRTGLDKVVPQRNESKKNVAEISSNVTMSDGIDKVSKVVIELPRYSTTSGGIRESIKLAKHIPYNVVIRFQRLTEDYPQLSTTWTVGLPDHTFPTCDVCITYSDNPYLSMLIALPQVKKVLIYMLSYGMAIERERKNILNKNVIVMCSTKKIEEAILKEGVKVHRIGFALDVDEMFNENKKRKNYLAIMYHQSQDKKYSMAVSVADVLYKRKIIDGVITFGAKDGYKNNVHPKGLIKHYTNANRDEIRKIFNSCKCFLMPSVSEGLNLTPAESTLCGCPAILCDGAIGELFFNRKNCFIAKHDDSDEMIKMVEDVMNNFDIYSDYFSKNMREITKEYTWDTVIKNINNLL